MRARHPICKVAPKAFLFGALSEKSSAPSPTRRAVIWGRSSPPIIAEDPDGDAVVRFGDPTAAETGVRYHGAIEQLESVLVPMTDEQRAQAAWAQLNLVLGFFARIDTKLSVILSLVLAMAATLFTRMPHDHPWGLVAWIGVVAYLILVGACMRALYRGAAPDRAGGTGSLLYFKPIAKMSESQFLGAVQEREMSALIEDLYGQVWRNSRILDAKFEALEQAYSALIASSLVWLALFAWLEMHR